MKTITRSDLARLRNMGVVCVPVAGGCMVHVYDMTADERRMVFYKLAD